MSNGKMSQDYKMLKIHSKKPLLYQSNSQKSLPEVENPGKEFYCMVHQEPVKRS